MAGAITTEEEVAEWRRKWPKPALGPRPTWFSNLTERLAREAQELDAYLANPASFKHVSVAISNAFVCPSCGPGRCDGTTLDCTLDSYYANPANGPRPSAGTAQNPDPLPAYGWGMWPGYTYPASKYDEDHSPPTERGPAPAVTPRCECGSGSSVRSGAHSHWCPCWVAP